MAHHIWRRSLAVAAGTAALTLGAATAASAHHCYKVDWNPNAYANHMSGNTAWMPLSSMGAMIISAPAPDGAGLPQCASYASVAVDHWMAQTGATSEPLIHSKATVGSGAAYQGKTVKPFAYLQDSDFAILEEGLGMAIGQCLADQGA